MRPVALAILLLILTFNAAAQQQTSERRSSERKPQITRADLGVAYLRLDTTFWQRTPTDTERIRAVNEEFDAATMAFFAGNFAQTLRVIDRISAELLADPPADDLLVALSLKADCDPPVAIQGQVDNAALTVRSLYRPEVKDQAELKIALTDAAAAAGAPPVKVIGTLAVAPDAEEIAREFDVTSLVRELSPGSYRIEAITADGTPMPLGRWSVVAESLDVLRERNAARLAQIDPESPQLQAALSACRDRNQLLNDRPSSEQSSQFLASPVQLAQEIAEEIAALEAGRDPYQHRAGDYWRTFRNAGKTVPLRVYAPQATIGDDPAPLVVALHGAGGDENMFFEGYGAGAIKQLADKYGAIVVTPSTYAMSRAEVFDALLEELGHTYAIDPERIYVLGHSMGGGATSRIAADRADRVAAACGLAGGGGRSNATATAPTLIIAAELDKIIAPSRLEPGAEKARADGLPVEYRLLPDYGHTLMVGKSLPDAFAWLFEHGSNR